MSDSVPAPAPVEPRAAVRRTRRWSTVWVVPLVALVLAGWLVYEHYSSKGTLAYVRFETADSIVSGKTEVRCRSVRVGIVETVELSDDLLSVVAALRIDPDSAHLLREGSRLWVVRPRVSASDVSGLGTIITGAYIELDPGEGSKPIHHFKGLEEPPATSAIVPGLRLVLMADEGGSLAAGAPIYFRGFEVGRVERRTFDLEQRRTKFDIFIKQDYAALVHEGTCFWNAGGVDVSSGPDGFRLRTPSLQAMIVGGVSFAIPPDGVVGNEAQNGAVYRLFPDEKTARESVFSPDRRILVFFEQSVRGLQKGAPVEFRGIPFGRVVDISLKYGVDGDPRIPVLIEVDPSTLRGAVLTETNEDLLLADAVKRGLRAKLGTGSLLTGSLFIDMDFVPDAPPAELTRLGEYDVLPTQASGLVQLEARVNAILAKIEALPIEETLTKFGKSADEITTTVAAARGAIVELDKLLAKKETQNIPVELESALRELRRSVTSLGPSGGVQGDVRRTMDELRAALRAFKTLSETVEEQPNSLIFGRESSGNPVPRARKP